MKNYLSILTVLTLGVGTALSTSSVLNVQKNDSNNHLLTQEEDYKSHIYTGEARTSSFMKEDSVIKSTSVSSFITNKQVTVKLNGKEIGWVEGLFTNKKEETNSFSGQYVINYGEIIKDKLVSHVSIKNKLNILLAEYFCYINLDYTDNYVKEKITVKTTVYNPFMIGWTKAAADYYYNSNFIFN